MSSILIPKEQQTAYQRWEMSSFSDGKAKPGETAAVTPEQLQAVFEKARKEGYAQGMKEGYFAGIDQAKGDLEQDKATLVELAAGFSESLEKTDERIAEDVLKLALDIAKAMLKTHLEVDPMAILPVVKEAINYLPSVKKPARIMLHPADAETVRKHMQEELNELGWLLVEDAALERGGCMVETTANQIDASNETRWRRIADALGQQTDWRA